MIRAFGEIDVVVIAASAGGIPVLERIMSRLPEWFPAPILVVQHMSPRLRSVLPEILARRSALTVREAKDGALLLPGHVYVAPPDRHLEVRGDYCALSDRERVNFTRPAADVLFASAARSYGSRTLGVVLTGYLKDGAEGSAIIRKAGGVVIAQDPSTCLASGMPEAAIRSGADFIVDPHYLPRALVSLVVVPGVTAMFGVGRYRPAA
jgi:two-component system chemotaxis response regulator CheB